MPVVLITGANSGFGQEGALAFARKGYTVYATVRNMRKIDNLQTAAEAANVSINIRELDVTCPETFSPFVDNIISEAGCLDVLVNNAGILRAGTLEDTSETSLREVMETNFFGACLLARTVLPAMRERGRGHIIMVSSLSGLAGLPGDFAYTASKFALEGATEALRHEVDRWGIKVALVEAGMYRTSILEASNPQSNTMPDYYPADSPYQPLIDFKLAGMRDNLPNAFDPAIVGNLFVEIAESDGSQLRWPADPVAKTVLSTMLGQDDATRDEFLADVSGTQWWSNGDNGP